MDKRAPGHWSHWSPLQWATIAAKNPPLFIRKNGKRPAATIFYNGVYIYDPLLLLLPLFSLFFNWIQWHSWGLSALCLPLLLLVADIADFFHTHKEGGGGGIPSSSSTRSLEGRRKTDPICTHFLLCIPDGPWENKIFLLSATISRSAYIVHGCLFTLDYLQGFIKTLTKRSTGNSLCQDYFRPRLTIF